MQNTLRIVRVKRRKNLIRIRRNFISSQKEPTYTECEEKFYYSKYHFILCKIYDSYECPLGIKVQAELYQVIMWSIVDGCCIANNTDNSQPLISYTSHYVREWKKQESQGKSSVINNYYLALNSLHFTNSQTI
jgi:hypothetical protein